MSNDFEWNYYEFEIVLMPNLFMPSCISLYAKKLYTEEELKKIVLTTFNANKQELIFIQDGKKFIDSVSLCEIVAENNSEITREYPFKEVLFSKLKVSEVAE
ncbi:hypothetical protein LAX75_12960 [Listeria cossartiae]|uniref:hypothetical protein n=1 Tax=Listeria cossartiae TaxID=2838249 RepID=UPI001E2C6555|nr:hypothetical protein [Listeria cossartiae]MCD2225525.1 hypothetical protein [Listeria cossartiae]MCD2240276.1 hypothetical protein [Listeria cossartiae]